MNQAVKILIKTANFLTDRNASTSKNSCKDRRVGRHVVAMKITTESRPLNFN